MRNKGMDEGVIMMMMMIEGVRVTPSITLFVAQCERSEEATTVSSVPYLHGYNAGFRRLSSVV